MPSRNRNRNRNQNQESNSNIATLENESENEMVTNTYANIADVETEDRELNVTYLNEENLPFHFEEHDGQWYRVSEDEESEGNMILDDFISENKSMTNEVPEVDNSVTRKSLLEEAQEKRKQLEEALTIAITNELIARIAPEIESHLNTMDIQQLVDDWDSLPDQFNFWLTWNKQTEKFSLTFGLKTQESGKKASSAPNPVKEKVIVDKVGNWNEEKIQEFNNRTRLSRKMLCEELKINEESPTLQSPNPLEFAEELAKLSEDFKYHIEKVSG